MKIELLNGFTRVNPKNTANVYNLEGKKMRKRRKRRSMTPETKQRIANRASRMKKRAQNLPLISDSTDRATMRSRAEERARVGNKRMNPQQMVMSGFDSNYFLKDNAIYSDTELLQFPGMALLASKATKGIGKLAKSKSKGSKGARQTARSMGIPRVETREAVNVLTGERLEQQEPELTRKQKRQSRRDKRREDRRATRRTRRMDRQEAKRKRQEQRQAMRLARAQARQDRKLAQTEARQQDNIIKAEARAGATESGQTFGQKVGDFFGQAGQGASQALKNLAQSQEFQDQFQDRTGIDPSFLLSDEQAEITPPEENFFEKNKIPLLIAGGGLAIYLFTRKKK